MPKLAGSQAFVIERWAFINNLNEELGWQGGNSLIREMWKSNSHGLSLRVCSSNKSPGLGHPAPLPHSDYTVEASGRYWEGGEIQVKVKGARFLKDRMGIFERACGA